jgi:hypothetical protein
MSSGMEVKAENGRHELYSTAQCFPHQFINPPGHSYIKHATSVTNLQSHQSTVYRPGRHRIATNSASHHTCLAQHLDAPEDSPF